MQKIILPLAIVLFLCSCSAPQNEDIYYLQAIGFDANYSKLTMSVVLEKGNTDDNSKEQQYFLEAFSDSTAKGCSDKLFDKYKKCYSGRSGIYVLGENLTRQMMYDIAVFLPSSPLYPNQSNVLCASTATSQNLLKQACKDSQLDKIKKLSNSGKNKVNAVHFFSLCMQQNTAVKIPTLELSQKGELSIGKKATYKNCAVSAK